MTATLLSGDCRELLPTLPAHSVQTIVTSPPYWRMRQYTDDPRELGQEDTPAAYVAALAAVFAACWRVLRDDGTLWLNLGDKYGAGGNLGRKDTSAAYLARRAAQYGTGTGSGSAVKNGSAYPRVKGIHSKNLLGLPWRVAFALQDAGWVLRNDIIWYKPNAMPEPVKDRCSMAHEYLFVFSKQGAYVFDGAAIAEPAISTTNRGGKKAQRLVQASGQKGDGFQERWKPKEIRNARTVWSIATAGIPDAHYAPMPEALARRCILAGSRPGDTVLDPFAGSGTTLRAAVSLERHAVGIDLGYADLQERRLDGVQIAMTALETTS